MKAEKEIDMQGGMEMKEKKSICSISPAAVVSGLLVGLVLISGIIIFGMGIKDWYERDFRARGYQVTDGFLTDYEIYREDEEGVSYVLIYQYHVNGKQYEVRTGYGVSHIPERGSRETVKYDPQSPEESFVVGATSDRFLIYFGAFFILGGLVFVFSYLSMKGIISGRFLGVYMSFVIFIIGVGIIVFQGGSFGIWTLVPAAMIVGGIAGAIRYFKGGDLTDE